MTKPWGVLFCLVAGILSLLPNVGAQDSSVVDGIVATAAADGIDLSLLSFSNEALSEIASIYEGINDTQHIAKNDFFRRQTAPTDIIDVHSHIVPDWYRAIVPFTGQNPTPQWNLSSHLSFAASLGITHSIISFSTPGANVFKGDQLRTIALARLVNEQTAAYARLLPDKFTFYAVVPLPYTDAAIREAEYAIKTLGAVGLALYSNFEGMYLGNPEFRPFFEAVDGLETGSGRKILFVHPGDPFLKVGAQFVEANPTLYPSGIVEFYFETARTIMDLTVSQTIHNFTNIDFVFPHVGGAFPSIIDRFLKSSPTIYNASMTIYQTRFWWDSAGPTYFHQVSGLLGYDIPESQLLFGTDFPYAPPFTQGPSLAALENTPLLTVDEKMMVLASNARALLGL
ncbi:hypothetical protein B0H34DRAFT_800966 [Crassisporium funariophilum]|nr:hypothetical protein B0H34DRAFT_800966 [Crassisporium funariophilum]